MSERYDAAPSSSDRSLANTSCTDEPILPAPSFDPRALGIAHYHIPQSRIPDDLSRRRAAVPQHTWRAHPRPRVGPSYYLLEIRRLRLWRSLRRELDETKMRLDASRGPREIADDCSLCIQRQRSARLGRRLISAYPSAWKAGLFLSRRREPDGRTPFLFLLYFEDTHRCK